MLSWASYLFGGSTAEPEKVENEPTQQESIAMETEPHPGDKDWVVIEHDGSDDVPRVGVSDLENLLIEHPSMSVYKRSCSEGDDSNHSDSSNELNMKSKRSQALSRQTPKRARAISAKAELMSQVMKVKNAQKVQQRHATKRSNKKGLDRRNKVAACDKLTTRKNRVRNPSGQMNGRLPQRKQ
ncbi:tumor protein p53-inducible nuclear protein 1-like [Mya arenaria]|uniref:tumor protein p53-inducible nuclear protein 1-like n=1 Tax=Mya arenaria TaxID=6604 RepID=UPI0022E98A50|nr:tumor protein p53-inducible nuclear protein 1-like [Mya arenaria]